MRIHILGIRGLPSTYSGYETFVGELAPRLAQRGHEITVYCRRSLFPKQPESWNGVQLRYSASLEHKVASTMSHSLFAMIAAVRAKPDVILSVNAATGWFSPIARMRHVPNVINVDGMEWLRPKWSGLGKFMLINGARMACRFGSVVVTDAEEMHRLYASQFGIESIDIAYGANMDDSSDPDIVRAYGLEPGKYFLVASRLVPDNNADLILEAFMKTRTDMKLAVAGGANYKGNRVERQFFEKLKAISNDRVKFLGHVDSNEAIKELHCNCFAYVHGHQFGGTNPSLLKALGYRNMILALDTPFNREALKQGVYGMLYAKQTEDLHSKMQDICDHPEKAESFREKARDRIRERYTWDHITDQYEALFDAVRRGVPRKDIHV